MKLCLDRCRQKSADPAAENNHSWENTSMTAPVVVGTNWTAIPNSPDISNLMATGVGTLPRPVVSFTADFTDLAPIALLIHDAGAVAGQDLRDFFNITVINDTGQSLSAFTVDVLDVNQLPFQGPGFTHPTDSHFHDTGLAGWNDPVFTGGSFSYQGQYINPDLNMGVLGSPKAPHSADFQGVNEIDFTGLSLAAGGTASLNSVGVHQAPRLVPHTGDFYLVLTPTVVSQHYTTVTEGNVGNDVLAPDLFNERNGLIFGYDGNDRIFGLNLGDTLVGGNGDDNLNGGSGDDALFGQAGNDTLVGEQGNDRLDGGGGTRNTAQYSGALDDYYLTQTPDARLVVHDLRPGSPDGTDTDGNIQYFDFKNVSYNTQELFRAPHDTAHDFGFNGGGTTDLLFRGDNSQELIWNLNGGGQAGGANLPNVSLDWHVAGIGDFNHDNSSDVFWHNDAGTNVVWQIQNNTFVGGFALLPTTNDWHVGAVGDFAGDAGSDLLWHNAGGENLIWQIQNGQAVGFNLPTTSTDWHVLGSGDVTGDGKADVLFHNDNGQNLVWQIQNGQLVGGFNLATTTSDWHVAGIADFNGDHISDILWHNDGGQNLIWQMQPNGAPPIGSILSSTPVEWHVLDVGDFTGDGTADILWHNDGGQNLVWQIQNSQIVGGFNLPTTTSEWHVV